MYLPATQCEYACLWVIHPKRGHIRIPLKSVDVEANVVDFCADVSIAQTFSNDLHGLFDVPLECVYVFPLDNKAAVYSMEVDIDGRKTVGHVEEKEQARATYNKAIHNGDSAQLLEQARSDVFQLKVGNLAPGETATVTIKYVAQLIIEDEAVRFSLPVSICPRYTPASAPRDQDTHTVAAGGGGISQLESGMSFHLNCCMPTPVVKISSPTHSMDATLSEGSQIASIRTSRRMFLDKELVVLISAEDPHKPRVCVEKSPEGTLAGLVTFCPKLKLVDNKCEFIFVVDRSGSMGGGKIEQASKSLSLFLHSLPADCYFNIIGFGSRHTKLWSRSKKYSNATLKEAVAHARGMRADLGGTELLAPLSEVFRSSPQGGYSRQVFVLTDGAVSNTSQVAEEVRRSNDSSRVFALGVGNDVSHELVEELAKAGRGTAEFAIQGERLEPKVIRQLNDAMQPSITDVTVEWLGLPPPDYEDLEKAEKQPAPLPSGMTSGLVGSLLGFVSPAAKLQQTRKTAPPTYQQSPNLIPPIFNGSRFLVHFLLDKDSKLPSAVKITATTPEGKLGIELPVKEEDFLDGQLVHRLAARSLLKDYESGTSYLQDQGASASAIENAAVKLGTKYQLASKWTSFVAVQHTDRDPVRVVPYYGPIIVERPAPTFGFSYAAPSLNSVQCQSSTLSASNAFYCAKSKKTSSMFSGLGQALNKFKSSAFGSSSAAPRRQSAAAPPRHACFSAAPASTSCDLFGSAAPMCPPPPPANSFGGAPPSSAPFNGFGSSGGIGGMAGIPKRARRKESAQQQAQDLLLDDMMESMDCLAAAPCSLAASSDEDDDDLLSRLQALQSDQPSKQKVLRRDHPLQIAQLQSFDGSFSLSPTLASLLESSEENIKTSVPSGCSLEAWCTALVIQFAKIQLAAYKDDWVLFISKAEKWLMASSGAGVAQAAAVTFF